MMVRNYSTVFLSYTAALLLILKDARAGLVPTIGMGELTMEYERVEKLALNGSQTMDLSKECRRHPLWPGKMMGDCGEYTKWRPVQPLWWEEKAYEFLDDKTDAMFECLEREVLTYMEEWPNCHEDSDNPMCNVQETKMYSSYKTVEEGELIMVQDAFTPQEQNAIESLASCMKQVLPNELPYFERRSFGAADSNATALNGNEVMFLSALLQIYVPGVAAQIMKTFMTAWEQSGWKEEGKPDPRKLGVRTIEFLRYTETGELGVHLDSGSAYTLVIAMSDTRDFEGGAFHLGNQHVKFRPEARNAMLIESETLHGVSHISKGIRKTLVIELWDYVDAPLGFARPTFEQVKEYEQKHRLFTNYASLIGLEAPSPAEPREANFPERTFVNVDSPDNDKQYLELDKLRDHDVVDFAVACRKYPLWPGSLFPECLEFTGFRPNQPDYWEGASYNHLGDDHKVVYECIEKEYIEYVKTWPDCSLEVNFEDPLCELEETRAKGFYHDDDDGELVTIANALIPQEAFALKTLSSCMREIFPRKLPYFKKRSFGKEENEHYLDSGNICTYMTGFLQIYIPGVAAQVIDIITKAWHKAGWSGEGKPNPNTLGFRTIEHLLYETSGSLGNHQDENSTYTMAVQLSDPEGYWGGAFHLESDTVKFKPNQYDGVVFESETSHGVSQLNRGKRQVFVVELWAQPDVPLILARPDMNEIVEYERELEQGRQITGEELEDEDNSDDLKYGIGVYS